MDYLLGLSDVDRHLNTAYSDLGLNDKTIDLLKEPKFNIRLLNELIEHEHFADFMADMEIYIDGLATIYAGIGQTVCFKKGWSKAKEKDFKNKYEESGLI